MIGGYMREKRFKYIFKDEFGYFHRVYTLKELANGELLKDTSAFYIWVLRLLRRVYRILGW